MVLSFPKPPPEKSGSAKFSPAVAATPRRGPKLVELAIRRGEGRLASTGAFVVETGQHTGRSAEDKYVVRDAETDSKIWWDNS